MYPTVLDVKLNETADIREAFVTTATEDEVSWVAFNVDIRADNDTVYVILPNDFRITVEEAPYGDFLSDTRGWVARFFTEPARCVCYAPNINCPNDCGKFCGECVAIRNRLKAEDDIPWPLPLNKPVSETDTLTDEIGHADIYGLEDKFNPEPCDMCGDPYCDRSGRI
jgi:hypothetical protein